MTSKKRVRATNRSQRPVKRRATTPQQTSRLCWKSKAVTRIGNDTFYDEIALDEDTIIRVGDTVSVLIEQEKKEKHTFSIGLIESMWQSNQEKRAEVRWLLSPHQVHIKGRAYQAHRKELFESDHVDDCSLEAVNEKIQVVDKQTYLRLRQQEGHDTSDSDDNGEIASLYFCEYFFDRSLHFLRPSLLFNRTKEKYVYSKRLAKERHRLNGNRWSTEGGDALRQAQRLLQLSSVPESLPCREAERGQVFEFLHDRLETGGGGSLYISGMPGTGKTATVSEVIRALEHETRKKGSVLPQFDCIEINAMKLSHPYDAYSQMYKALTGKTASKQRASQHLEQLFAGSKPRSPTGRPCVVIVDELDFMVTRKQTVLYNFFDWPTRPNSWMTCIGIANTMDLPERLLPRIHSRMGMSRIVFKTYQYDQLRQIVAERLRGVGVFEPASIEICAKKVASISGDIRRALHICRKSIEYCQLQGESRVTFDHVMKVTLQLKHSPLHHALPKLALLDKLVCVALCKRLNSCVEEEEVHFESVFHTVSTLWPQTSAGAGVRLEPAMVWAACLSLEQAKVFSMSCSDTDRTAMLSFGPELSESEVRDVFQEDDDCRIFF